MVDTSTSVHSESVTFLTGQHSSEPWPGGISLPGRGGKFATDGSVQSWPGNTFISHVDAHSAAHQHLRAMQEEIKMSRFSPFLTFLPPSSFHMTLFEGVAPANTDVEQPPLIADQISSRDARSTQMLDTLDKIYMPATQTVAMDSLFCATGLRVHRVGEHGDEPLRAARELLRKATGINPPGFDTYGFHITLAYLVEWLTRPTAEALVEFSQDLYERYRERLSAITLGPVEFCNFDTMHHFKLLKRLV